MRASAIHSLLSPEHGPECVPLVGALSDELLEATDHALHHLLFGLATVQIQGRLEVDAVPPRRCSELCRGHEGRAGLDRNRGGAARHITRPPKKRTCTPGPCSRSQRRATMWFALSASVMARTAARPSMITCNPNRRRVCTTASFSEPGNRSATA